MEVQPTEDVEKRTAERTGMDPIIVASAASVLLSWYQFYVRGNKEHGIFVGLWPPTLVGLASYMRLTRMEEKMDRAGASGVVRRVQKMLQEQ